MTEPYKIIRKSNFNHEDYRGNQYPVAELIRSSYLATVMCDALNAHGGPYSEDFYEVVSQSHVLPPDWEP